MSEPNRWTVSITFSEDDDRTRADADLEGAPVQLSGYGTSRRNPVDPNLPAVGEEIAAARALGDRSTPSLETTNRDRARAHTAHARGLDGRRCHPATLGTFSGQGAHAFGESKWPGVDG